MELGDLDTLMLKNKDFNYQHNKKLLKFIFDNKKEYFFEYKNFEEIFHKENKEEEISFPMIDYCNIKFPAKKIFMKILFKEILIGLKYIHTKGISHRDIKPENIVYSSKEKCCKIIDFSISTFIQKNENEISDEDLKNYFTKEPGGSIHFQAPEQYEIGSYNPFISDIWSLGITIYIFLFEEYPFDCNCESELELQIRICEKKLNFPDYIEDCEDVKLFLEAILLKDWKLRLSLDDIIEKLEKL